jgi:hypothetical protein
VFRGLKRGQNIQTGFAKPANLENEVFQMLIYGRE